VLVWPVREPLEALRLLQRCESVCRGRVSVVEAMKVSVHCYKTFCRIPPPSPDDAGIILLGRGKRLLYMGREFAPSGTEVFRNHWKFSAIFTMKKGRTRMVGSNSVPLDYYSCPLPPDHGYHVLNVKKYTVINIEYQRESIKSNI
jgi:hypothetical protein